MFNGKELLLEDSLNSIVDIAEDSGLDYEIIVVNTTLLPLNPVSTEGVNENKSLKILDLRNKARGAAKNEVLRKSIGTHIVLFDPEKVYDISYADVIYTFINMREKRMLFSEFIIIPKDMILENGGWGNLSVSEDLDLFTRLSESYGILFYITEGPESLERFLTYKPNQIISSKHYKRYGFKKRVEIIRDMLVGCNYGMKDVMLLAGADNDSYSLKNYLVLSIASFSKRLRMKGKRPKKSNFTILMEALFESIVLLEFEKIKITDKPLSLDLGKNEIRYLSEKSEMFIKISSTLNKIIKVNP
jgi:hypothetical protein